MVELLIWLAIFLCINPTQTPDKNGNYKKGHTTTVSTTDDMTMTYNSGQELNNNELRNEKELKETREGEVLSRDKRLTAEELLNQLTPLKMEFQEIINKHQISEGIQINVFNSKVIIAIDMDKAII